MKLLDRPLFYSALLFGSALIASAQGAGSGSRDMAEYLEEDLTFMVLVPDLPGLISEFGESAFGELVENEDLREYLLSLVKSDAVVEDGESTEGEVSGGLEDLFGGVGKEQWKEYGHFFDGGLALGITVPPLEVEKFEEWSPEEGGHFLIVAEFSGEEEDFAAFLDPWSDQHPENMLPGEEGFAFEEDFMGHTLFIEEVINEEGDLVRRNGWSLVDGVVVIGEPIDSLRDVVARIADPSEGGGIADSDRFLELRDRSGGGDLFLFLELEELAKVMGTGMEMGLSMSLNEGGNPLGIDPAKVVEAIGLGVLESLHLSVDFGPGESVVRGGLSYSEKKGVLSLLSYGDGPIPFSSLPPVELVSSSVGRVRWGEIWNGIKEMLGEISPNLAMMLEAMRANFQQTTGVDFERSLIGALGEETVTYATLRENAAPDSEGGMKVDSVVAVQIQDPSGFELALAGIKGMFGLTAFFEETEFDGTTIFTSKLALPADPGAYFSYALTQEFFLFGTGSAGLLPGAISRMNSRGEGFWNLPEVQDVVAELPEETVGATYSDLGLLLDNLIQMSVAMSAADPDAEEVPEALQNLSKGDFFPHFVITGQMPDESGFYFESVILPLERLGQ